MKAKKKVPDLKKAELLVAGITDVFDIYEPSNAEAMIALMYMMREIVDISKADPVPVAAAVAAHMLLDTKKPAVKKKKTARK